MRIMRLERIFEYNSENNGFDINNVKEDYYVRFIFKLYLIKIAFFIIPFIIRLFNNYDTDNEVTTPIELILPSWIEYKTLNKSSCYLAFWILKIIIDLLAITMLVYKSYKIYCLNKENRDSDNYNLIYIKIEIIISSLIVCILILLFNINRYANINLNAEIVLLITSILLSILPLISMICIFFNLQDTSNDNSQFSCLSEKTLENFNLLMLNKKAYKVFYNFLKENDFIDGSNMLLFYIDYMIILNRIRNSKHNQITNYNSNYSYVCNDNSSDIMKHKFSCNNLDEFSENKSLSDNLIKIDNFEFINIKNSLFEKFVDKGSQMSIDFPSELINSIHSSYTDVDSKKLVCNDEWNKLVKFCYNALKNDYFLRFKQSVNYQNLKDSIKEKEKIMNNFIIASIIDDNY